MGDETTPLSSQHEQKINSVRACAEAGYQAYAEKKLQTSSAVCWAFAAIICIAGARANLPPRAPHQTPAEKELVSLPDIPPVSLAWFALMATSAAVSAGSFVLSAHKKREFEDKEIAYTEMYQKYSR